ncbi:MAG: trypsin-like peptidase domain-containing protein [Planctomycetaceae bacterium]|nr:trypsin-like peptidase domain-containing protein [Planctomycetaceae bacterium]
MLRRHTVVLCLSLLAVSLTTPVTRASDFDIESLQDSILETVRNVRPAVVNITGRGTGFSGVIVSPEGHVLSAAHAVTPGATYRISLPDGRRFRGVGKGSNPRTDSALIMITEPGDDLPFVPMGDSSSLVTNQPCLGLSFPGGQRAGREPIVRFGRVVRSSRNRGMLQSSALMEPGDSGGPLFDLNGYVIGIHSRIGRDMERNYEVPVDTFRNFWNELNREQTFTQSGPPTPKLGVQIARGRRGNTEESAGLKIVAVVDDSRAAKGGIKVDDAIVNVYDRDMSNIEDLRAALIAARDEGVETITAKVQRGEETLDIEMEFEVEREGAPEVALPDIDHPKVEAEGYGELSRLARELAELETTLDDMCVEIESLVGEKQATCVGTMVKGTPWIISKSSLIGSDPVTKSDDQETELTIVRRDSENDLVLLKTADVCTAGIDLESSEAELAPGVFILTPESDGDGIVSVIGTPSFASAKLRSRGFLGVVPATFEDNKGAIINEVTENGAAKKAGVLVGDVITKLNDTIIRTHSDMRNFLSKADPNAVITATLKRDEDELTKSITLGSLPSTSRHAADQMAKSTRRDGFRQVLSHDADLKPADCGSPVFDLQGRFAGLNIARNSRVRSYTLPAAALKAFLAETETEEKSE